MRIVQVNVALPLALVVSVAVTVTVELPRIVGVPLISPVEGLIVRPAGKPVAVKARVCPGAESVAWICRLTGAPITPVWLPGLVTVTVLPGLGVGVGVSAGVVVGVGMRARIVGHALVGAGKQVEVVRLAGVLDGKGLGEFRAVVG